jgi:DNA invertase Pin-like site-specific DNA recombinase
MRERLFVAYYRVSTGKQGRSGLGLDAQRHAVETFVQGRGRLLQAFTEVESGKNDQRPELAAALAHCDLTGATLVVAKLDRLSRNVAFLATLQDSGVRFLATDMPEANELTIHIMAAVAQAERKAISKRTKEALAAAKARGVRLGGDRGKLQDLKLGPCASALARSKAASERRVKVLKQVQSITSSGDLSLRQIAGELNRRAVTTPRGGLWSAAQVRRVLAAGD